MYYNHTSALALATCVRGLISSTKKATIALNGLPRGEIDSLVKALDSAQKDEVKTAQEIHSEEFPVDSSTKPAGKRVSPRPTSIRRSEKAQALLGSIVMRIVPRCLEEGKLAWNTGDWILDPMAGTGALGLLCASLDPPLPCLMFDKDGYAVYKGNQRITSKIEAKWSASQHEIDRLDSTAKSHLLLAARSVHTGTPLQPSDYVEFAGQIVSTLSGHHCSGLPQSASGCLTKAKILTPRCDFCAFSLARSCTSFIHSRRRIPSPFSPATTADGPWRRRS
jgi:hypothetical protein